METKFSNKLSSNIVIMFPKHWLGIHEVQGSWDDHRWPSLLTDPDLVVALAPKEGVITDEGRGFIVSGPDSCLAMASPPCHVVSDTKL